MERKPLRSHTGPFPRPKEPTERALFNALNLTQQFVLSVGSLAYRVSNAIGAWYLNRYYDRCTRRLIAQVFPNGYTYTPSRDARLTAPEDSDAGPSL